MTPSNTTWSGSQAATAMAALKICLDNKMVKDFFDETENEVLQVLLERAEAGHALSVGRLKLKIV